MWKKARVNRTLSYIMAAKQLRQSSVVSFPLRLSTAIPRASWFTPNEKSRSVWHHLQAKSETLRRQRLLYCSITWNLCIASRCLSLYLIWGHTKQLGSSSWVRSCLAGWPARNEKQRNSQTWPSRRCRQPRTAGRSTSSYTDFTLIWSKRHYWLRWSAEPHNQQ
jgi:hypothetical protein